VDEQLLKHLHQGQERRDCHSSRELYALSRRRDLPFPLRNFRLANSDTSREIRRAFFISAIPHSAAPYESGILNSFLLQFAPMVSLFMPAHTKLNPP
jgi:hypothetical protein